MSEINIFSITESDDARLAQVERLFVEFYQYMHEKGVKTPLPEGGEKLWLDAVRKTIKRFSRLVVATENDAVIGFAQ